jgi:signal peptidase I
MRWTAAALMALVLGVGGARLLGYDAFVVTSGSMAPTIAVGSLIVVQAVPPVSIGVGDVVTYALPDRVVTHRVQQISQEDGRVAFVTRGDANDVTDPWLAEPQGTVGALRAVVPFAGFAVAAVQAWWRLIAAALLAWLLIESLAVRLRERGPRAVMRHPAHV